ncbi:hypothetical protein SPURM210S_06182 [Streptomyces purpurascens]
MGTRSHAPEDAAATSYAFDVDAFLRRPLTARLATNGPTVRPVWFLWEEDAFWTTSTTIRPLRGTVWLRLRPTSLVVHDLSYAVAS